MGMTGPDTHVDPASHLSVTRLKIFRETERYCKFITIDQRTVLRESAVSFDGGGVLFHCH
jgi:hypothetical protein